MTGRGFCKLLVATFREWRADKAGRLAAALAYYAVIAFAPLVVLILGVGAQFFGERAAQGQLVQAIRLVVGPDAANAVQAVVVTVYTAQPGYTAAALSLVTFMWGASHLFAQLKDALNTIWQVRRKTEGSVTDWLRTRALAIVGVLGFGVVFGLVLALENGVSLVAAQFGITPRTALGTNVLTALTLSLSFVVIGLLTAAIYKTLPDAVTTWRDVWIGAAVTSVLLIAGQSVIGLYLGESQFAAVYGALGSAIVLLIWAYFSAQIMLFGAEFTWMYANRYGSHVVPAEDAIPFPPNRAELQPVEAE